MTSQFLIPLISQYGYIGLFVILLITILGLPVPVEFLLAFVGFLSFTGQLNPVLAIIFAAAGCAAGSTISYFLGIFFQHKIIGHLEKHAGGKRLEKMLNWYQLHGEKLLTAGYFIPGLRHVSGYIAGFSKLEFRKFALYSYLGATLWTAMFIMLGQSLGSRWKILLPVIHHYALLLAALVVILSALFYLVYKKYDLIMLWLNKELSLLSKRYLSLGKRRLLITAGSFIFIFLFLMLMSLIQDFVFHEVGQFDTLVISWLSERSLGSIVFMRWMNILGTHMALMLILMLATMIMKKKTKNWMHVRPLVLAWGGGTVIEQLFRVILRGENIEIFAEIFTQITPFQAPSSGFLLAALSFYIVLAYLIGRKRTLFAQGCFLLGGVVLVFLLALSTIFLQVHTPSAMVASIIVSGLWALVCGFVYEFRIYQTEKNQS